MSPFQGWFGITACASISPLSRSRLSFRNLIVSGSRFACLRRACHSARPSYMQWQSVPEGTQGRTDSLGKVVLFSPPAKSVAVSGHSRIAACPWSPPWRPTATGRRSGGSLRLVVTPDSAKPGRVALPRAGMLALDPTRHGVPVLVDEREYPPRTYRVASVLHPPSAIR